MDPANVAQEPSSPRSLFLQIWQSLRRICLALLAIFVSVAGVAWLVWGPVGTRVVDGRHDRGRNGIWVGHGWLGDDAWFDRQKGGSDKRAFRSPAALDVLARRLRSHGITDVFPHLCPADADGRLPGIDPDQVNRLLDALSGFRILPWVGGNTYRTARFREPSWRSTFADSCALLIQRFPRFAGVHLNLEPCPSGDTALLLLLAELRRKLPPTALISISAYPPPTPLQPGLDVHWDEPYVRQIAPRVDQFVFMMYDTGLWDCWTYRRLLRQWTQEALAWTAPTAALLGLPAYDDAWAAYHRPEVENLENALLGLHAGLTRLGSLPSNYQGAAIYCLWEMNDDKWAIFRELFVRPSQPPPRQQDQH